MAEYIKREDVLAILASKGAAWITIPPFPDGEEDEHQGM